MTTIQHPPHHLGWPERIENYLLGSSVLSWAILGWLGDPPESRMTAVRIAITALHLVVGILLFTRQPLRKAGGWRLMLLAIPALVLSGFALHVAPPPSAWAWGPGMFFFAGAGWAIVSLVQLGGSFAIFPALRQVVVAGPFRIVRHPAYLGELALFFACAGAAPFSWKGWGLAALAVFFVILRIHGEEMILSEDPQYREYSQSVRYRLLPGLY